MSAGPELDVNIVRKFRPFDSQSNDKIKEIISKSAVHTLPADRILFNQGDRDHWTIYLLSGAVELAYPDGDKQLIEADSEIALDSIANQIPRIATATSQTDISIIAIERSLLQIILDHDDGGIEVSGIDDDDDSDWMSRFLQSNAFLQLPAANIQALMMRLKEKNLTAGCFVIKENSRNDDKFYIIQEGSCLVTKTNPLTGQTMNLAQLNYGTGFGEEALITDGVRSANVIMNTDGIVMVLEKKDFLELLVEPLIHRIEQAELDEIISTGHSILIDVRDESEFQHQQLAHTEQNIPIHMIRSQLEQLDKDKHYIVYSNHEYRSSAAAFLFIQQGFDCSILKGGIAEEAPIDSGDSEITEPAIVENIQLEEIAFSSEYSLEVTAEQETSKPDDFSIIVKNTDTDTSLSEQLAAAENACKKYAALTSDLKARTKEATKFAKLKARQVELLNQKLKTETQRADHAEARLKQLQAEIEQ